MSCLGRRTRAQRTTRKMAFLGLLALLLGLAMGRSYMGSVLSSSPAALRGRKRLLRRGCTIER